MAILLIDDDVELCELLFAFLQREGFAVEAMHRFERESWNAIRERVELVVLDVGLPGLNGFEVLRLLRDDSRVPVLMLTARGDDIDRIVGLELGADDYLPKPCNPRELLARVRAVLRRRQEPRAVDDAMGAACEFAGWRLDLVRRELRSPQSVVVNLSSGEFSLLRAFVERPQRVLTRDQLLDLARGRDSDAYDRAIDVQISRLRRKLDDGGGRVKMTAMATTWAATRVRITRPSAWIKSGAPRLPSVMACGRPWP